MADGRTRNLRLYSQGDEPAQPRVEDDPLIELARIVSEDGGFYRTRPVRESRPPPAEAAQPKPFSPELESELLQELELPTAPERREARRRPLREATVSRERPTPDEAPRIPIAPPPKPANDFAEPAPRMVRPPAPPRVRDDRRMDPDPKGRTPGPTLAASARIEDVVGTGAAPDEWTAASRRQASDLRGALPDDPEAVYPRAANRQPKAAAPVDEEPAGQPPSSESYADFEDTFAREFEAIHARRYADEARTDADGASDEEPAYFAPYGDDAAEERAERSSAAAPAAPRPAGSRSPSGRPSRRGLLTLAGVLGLVAVGGGVAAMMAASGPADVDAPIPVIRADTSAVKIMAEVQAADADAAEGTVFERAANDAPGADENLVERVEEPRDVATAVPPLAEDGAETALDGVAVDEMASDGTAGEAVGPDKIEERISSTEPGATGTESDPAFVPIGPRRVRTITIGPDGTVVPSAPVVPADVPPATQNRDEPRDQMDDAPQPVTVRTVKVTPPGADAPAAAPEASQAGQAAGTAGEGIEVAALDAQTVDAQPGDAGDDAAALETQAFAMLPRARPADRRVAEVAEPVAQEAPAAQEVQVAARQDETAAAPAAAPEQAEPAAAAPADGFVVQVSSQRSAAQAQQALDGLKQRFPSLLGDQRTEIQQVDLGAKGTYHRVRVGPMATRAEAVRLCERLKAAGGSCLVTR